MIVTLNSNDTDNAPIIMIPITNSDKHTKATMIIARPCYTLWYSNMSVENPPYIYTYNYIPSSNLT